jgi:WD40 repeat protein
MPGTTRSKLFLSYARGDDEPFVRRLYDDLQSAEFDVWFDRPDMPSRLLTFYQEIRDAIAERDRVLLVVGPKAATSDYVNQEWRSALEMGKCVNPIVRLNGQGEDGGFIDGYSLVPEELRLIHAEDFRDDSRYEEHLENLVRQLAEPAPPLGKLVAVPTLPPHYRAQPERLKALRDALLVDLQKPVVITGAAARVGVQGMGGIGKSVLAAALARDQNVRRAFPDGIIWIPFGQEPNTVELQRQTARALGNPALFDNTYAGKNALRTLLAERAVLLILDNVWRRVDADAFDVLGSRCKLLLTTRDAGLVTALAGTDYQVQLPSEEEALALLASAAGVALESLPSLGHEVVSECGRLPLALALCGGMVQAGTLWSDLLGALREHELEFLANEYAAEEYHRNLWRAMELGVRVLPEEEQRRFEELAVFPADAKVPEAAVVTLWTHTGGMSERHARDLLVRLKRRSLVLVERPAGAIEPVSGEVSLHDLLHDFATRLATRHYGNLASLHDQLLSAYRNRCSNGWPTGPNDGYFLERLVHHLVEAGHGDQLVSLLLDLPWLEAKTEDGLVFDLPLEFDLARRVVPPEHPRFRLLPLVAEAIRRDIHFIARHPTTLFQCLWNTCWWYDCPEAAKHYESADGPWNRPGEKLCDLLQAWRMEKEKATPGFPWVRSLRPPAVHLGTAQLAVLRGHEYGVTSVSYSPEGGRIVSGSRNGTARVWDAESGACLAVFRGHEDMVHSVAYSPDGRRIASGSYRTVRVWDAESGTCLAVLCGHDSWVDSVSYSPDGRRIASGSADKTVRVWDAESGRLLAALRGHEDTVHSVAYSPDGRRIASGSWDRTVRVWDAESGASLAVLHGLERVQSVAYSPDGRRIASASHETVRVWDAERGTPLAVLEGLEGSVKSATFSPDGRRIFTGCLDHTLRIWDAESGACLAVLHGHQDWVESVSVSPDGRRIVTGSGDKAVRVWDAESGGPLAVLRGHHGVVQSLSFSPDGQRIATASRSYDEAFHALLSNTVRLWDAESGVLLAVLCGHERTVSSLSYSTDSRRIVSGSWDKTVRLWDADTGECLAVLRGHEDKVESVSFSADCRRMVSGSMDKTVRIWDAESGAPLAVLHGHDGVVGSVSFSPDGRRIASGSEDRTVRVWDAESGAPLAVLRGHEYAVSSITFSPDGRRVASGSLDGTVQVWDLDSSDCLGVLRGHTSPVVSVAYSPEGRSIISGSYYDEMVRVWDAASRECLEVIHGVGDVLAMAAGSRWRALGRALETVIEDARPRQPVAWFPEALQSIATHPSGRTWAGPVQEHLYIIMLEGNLA